MHRFRLPTLLLTLPLCFMAARARGETLHVDPSGPLDTIQAAIDSAQSGDTLLLAPAIFSENPLVRDKDLTIRSAAGSRAVLDAAPLAGGGNAGNGLRVVRSFVRLESIVIRNATPAPTGAAILLFTGQVQMRHCRLENNWLGAFAADIAVPGQFDIEECEIVGSDLGLQGRRFTRVVRTRFEGNRRALGALGEVELIDVEVVGNGVGNEGFGVVLGESWGRLEGLRIHDNRGWIPGLWMERGPFEVSDCIVENNTSLASPFRLGGPAGIAFVRVSDATLRGCVSRSNRASGAVDGVGGLYIDRSRVRVDGCRIENNQSEVDGGGIRVHRGSNVELVGCSVVGNRSDGDGGGLYVHNASVRLDSVVVAGNESSKVGGGIAAQFGATLTIQRSTMASNVAPTTGGIFLLEAGALLESSIVAFNEGGPTLLCAGTLALSCTDIYGNTDDELCGSDLGGNVSVDPQFCDLDPDRESFDLRLRRGSPVATLDGCGGLGALSVACEPVSAQPITWSRLKRLYRPPTSVRRD
ncbi:MAG: right-handed parallel beta-helix repeat-containing protein [Candidatus Latescibacterota bacterium]|nr:MAG: right-handed parallel beta-helix repeat-containing protein [Candidatus Latescibacterota bacterium]